MSNTFMNGLKNSTNYDLTANGGLAHKSTLDAVYDMFAFGGAYRQRSDNDCIVLFQKAYVEDPVYALKCLFYLRDCRGGQGERRFFRICFKWLVENYPAVARRNLIYCSEYGRWDDMIYTTYQTALWSDCVNIIKEQLTTDINSFKSGDKTGISLLAKWLPSINTSSNKTKIVANKLCHELGMTHKQYRKTLAVLRERIKVLERLMSANRWDEIVFDKIPSKAGLIYKNAFARRDMIAQKYKEFVADKTTKVNAGTLFPYEVVAKVLNLIHKTSSYYRYNLNQIDEVDRMAINKYWENLPDVLKDASLDALAVVDTSGSMWGSTADAPINVAISLGLYCAERARGPFANHYISFSSRPQLIETVGVDFVDKVYRIYETNLCENTNLEATFDMLLQTAINNKCKQSDLPKTLIVISDMQIDQARGMWGNYHPLAPMKTMMEQMRDKWKRYGYELPNIIYWNVNATRDTILDDGPNVTYISGASQSIFTQVLTGKTGISLMYETLDSERYAPIK